MSPIVTGIVVVVAGGLVLVLVEQNVLEGTIKGILGGAGNAPGASPAALAGNPISVSNYNRAAVTTFGYHPVAVAPAWNQGVLAMHG